MAVSKVQFDGQTLIDLTADTVTAARLQSGYTAHNSNGEKITGTLALPSGSLSITANGTYNVTDKASAVVNVPIGSQNSKAWTLTLASDTARGESVTIVNEDSWLLAHKNDSSLVITLVPLQAITPAAYRILAYIHTMTKIDSTSNRYGRSIRCSMSNASLSDNNPTQAISAGNYGFMINANGGLTFVSGDGGSSLILPAGSWLITASVSQ
jgi:hypothetical protein